MNAENWDNMELGKCSNTKTPIPAYDLRSTNLMVQKQKMIANNCVTKHIDIPMQENSDRFIYNYSCNIH